MTLEDAKKVTQLLDAIGATTSIRSEQGEAPGADTIRRHVNELRQILDLRALVEQNHPQGPVSLKLERHTCGTPSLVVTPAAPPWGRIGSVLSRVLVGQHASAEGRPRGDAETELLRHRDELALDRSFDRRVFDLQRDERRPSAKARRHLRLRDLPRRGVREPDVAHLPGGHEIIERAHRLVDRREPIPQVHAVQVDIVGRQPPQRFVARRRHRFSTGPAAVGVTRKQIGEKLFRPW